MAEPRLLHVNDDGTAIGVLDDVLYAGIPRQFGYDEVVTTVETEEVDDDVIVTHVATLGGGIQGKGSYTRSAVLRQHTAKYVQTLEELSEQEFRERYGEPIIEDATQTEEEGDVFVSGFKDPPLIEEVAAQMAEVEWERILNPPPPTKQHITVLHTDGHSFDQVERKLTVYEWVVM